MSATLNIVADQQILHAADIFSAFGKLQLVNGRDIDRETVRDADVLLVRSVTPVNAGLLENSRVQFVGSATAGIDHIDVSYLQQRNISFSYAPGSNARSVAEYVLSSLLYLAHTDGFDLQKKTIGIIGVGEVGSRVQQILQSLGLRCLLNDPPRAEREQGEQWLPLDALRQADIISCHVPLTTTGRHPTRHLVNREFLQQLKPDVILINTSRGDVINEADLLQFVEARSHVRLVLDVWSGEPDIDISLLEKSTVATPHIAGYSYDGKLKASLQLAQALAEHLQQPAQTMPGKVDSSGFITVTIEGSGDPLYQAVMQVYDVSQDCRQLKQLMAMDQSERQACFDWLRKSYPVRREFAHATVKSNTLSDIDQRRLQSLGFNLEAA